MKVNECASGIVEEVCEIHQLLDDLIPEVDDAEEGHKK